MWLHALGGDAEYGLLGAAMKLSVFVHWAVERYEACGGVFDDCDFPGNVAQEVSS